MSLKTPLVTFSISLVHTKLNLPVLYYTTGVARSAMSLKTPPVTFSISLVHTKLNLPTIYYTKLTYTGVARSAMSLKTPLYVCTKLNSTRLTYTVLCDESEDATAAELCYTHTHTHTHTHKHTRTQKHKHTHTQ
jgi:hypothetical protein